MPRTAAETETFTAAELAAVGAAMDASIAHGLEAAAANQAKSERKQFRINIAAMRTVLSRRFPKAFLSKGSVKRPLALGIDKAIIEAWPDVDPVLLKEALWDYTRGMKYLVSCIEGAERVGLDGSPAGLITADQAGFAKGLLKKLTKKFGGTPKRNNAGPAMEAA